MLQRVLAVVLSLTIVASANPILFAASAAGQISGVEGYVESAASGLLVSRFIAERLAGREPRLPPATTALGGLIAQLSRNPKDYQPSNITFSHLEPYSGTRLKKRAKYEAMAERALGDLGTWLGVGGEERASAG